MNNNNIKIKDIFSAALENHKKNNFKLAANLYKEILKINPDHIESIFHLGSLSVQIGNFERASQLLSKTVQIDPSHFKALNNLGVALKELGELQKAINCCKKAIKIQPNFTDAHNNLGLIFMELEENKKAIGCYKKAIKIDPNYVNAYNNLGVISAKLNLLDEAKVNFEKSLNLDPNNKKACEGYGYILLKLNQHNKALEYIRKGTGFIEFTQKNLKLFKENKIKKKNIHSHQTHFIGCWNLENNKLCSEIINFFENNKSLQRPGISASGKNLNIKKTTDIAIEPDDLKKQKFEILKQYINELHKCFLNYQNEWPFLKSIFKTVLIPGFNIQKYSRGDHFAALHSERTSLDTLHRIFAWMTYLNDVDDGGQTNFNHYGIKIKPETGKTLIWPAEWTHAHTGEILTSGTKYIVTGWMHFPASI